MTLIPIYIKKVTEWPELAWTEGHTFNIPQLVLEKSGLCSAMDEQGGLELSATLNIQITLAEVESLRQRAAFITQKPLSSRLPISYQLIPPRIRSYIASLIGHIQRTRTHRWASFPAWPLDLSTDFLADLAGIENPLMPDGKTPVILTHDIDSAEGLINLPKFLKMEEQVGARSVNFIVPCGWPLDHGRLHEIIDRGHEIGIHGYNHSNTTAFCKPAIRYQRFKAMKSLIEKFFIKGYRAPSLLRNQDLLGDLSSCFKYDSSIPTSGGLFPVPNNGCASARTYEVEGIIEIPLSMPRDGSLRFLGYSPEQILSTWIECAESISAAQGNVVLLTHCEKRFCGSVIMQKIYQQFLNFIASNNQFKWSTPVDILKQN